MIQIEPAGTPRRFHPVSLRQSTDQLREISPVPKIQKPILFIFQKAWGDLFATGPPEKDRFSAP
jgi:hypothetical protein